MSHIGYSDIQLVLKAENWISARNLPARDEFRLFNKICSAWWNLLVSIWRQTLTKQLWNNVGGGGSCMDFVDCVRLLAFHLPSFWDKHLDWFRWSSLRWKDGAGWASIGEWIAKL